ncbi:MAG: adenosine deaminase [Paludibacteraceae bacterium]
MTTKELQHFLKEIPKCELHLHIEGSFEPELMFEMAKRNNIKTKFNTIEELRAAYQFGNLQEFLDLYYEGASALLYEKDFYDLTMAYFGKCAEDNVVHTEIFVDPQTHTMRGVSMEAIINGIYKAMIDAKKQWKISSYLIVCFLRHLNEASALETFRQALPFKDKIIGFGLDSSEVGHPPMKFAKVFDQVRSAGFHVVAHAGEEGPADYIWEALNTLKVSRIDHGVRSLEDEVLVKYLAENKIPLTVCPLSNLKLQVVKKLEDHPLKKMLDKHLIVTINSDDPAYFGGYVNENFLQTAEALQLTKSEIINIAKNSFVASYLPKNIKLDRIEQLERIEDKLLC